MKKKSSFVEFIPFNKIQPPTPRWNKDLSKMEKKNTNKPRDVARK